MADSLPQHIERPELPDPSTCLEWERRVKEWGLPNPGTWLDQPKWFMEDIKAASNGWAEWMNKEAEQDNAVSLLNVPIPQMGMVVQR